MNAGYLNMEESKLRVAIVYPPKSRKMEAIVEAISSSSKEAGHQVQQIRAVRGIGIKSLFPYDLVYVGSPVMGLWGGKFSEEIASFIRECSGLEGKKVAVFVIPKMLGVSKAIKRLMALLEKQGSIIIDFRRIRNLSEARAFGQRLSRKILSQN